MCFEEESDSDVTSKYTYSNISMIYFLLNMSVIDNCLPSACDTVLLLFFVAWPLELDFLLTPFSEDFGVFDLLNDYC